MSFSALRREAVGTGPRLAAWSGSRGSNVARTCGTRNGPGQAIDLPTVQLEKKGLADGPAVSACMRVRLLAGDSASSGRWGGWQLGSPQPAVGEPSSRFRFTAASIFKGCTLKKNGENKTAKTRQRTMADVPSCCAPRLLVGTGAAMTSTGVALVEYSSLRAAEPALKQQLHGLSKGKIFAVTHGAQGPGLFDEWRECGVVGCAGADYKVFEFNPNSPLYDKKRTHEAARLEALVWLHGALRLPRPAEIVERERAEELAAQKRAEGLPGAVASI